MADIDKNILIIPNKGQTSEPTMTLTGKANNPITLRVLDDNTLSFEGSAGQLFSISPSLTGTIFSVNDISGIPSIEVDDTGEVRIAEFSGNVGIGKASPAYKLDVNGVVRATSFIGDIAGNASTATTLATARTISLTGAVTGSVSFNGSGDVSIATTHTADPTITLTGDVSGSGTMTNLGSVSITATVADDSHNHIISNVDGLQTALDGKQPTGSYLTTATTFGGDVSGAYNAIVVANDSHTHTASTLPSTMTPSAHTLDSHSNVTITSNTAGELLKWNGTAWVNNTLTEAGIQPAGSYLTTSSSFGGDVSGTYNAIVVANDSHTHSFNNLTSKPTTLAGYGITDAIPKVSTAVTGNIPEFNSTGILVDSGVRIEDIATGGRYAILNRYSTTLSSSSTTVTFNIANFESQTDALIVYENLVYYLEPGVDYTLTNNTTITLLNGAKPAGTKYDFIAIANVPEELGTYSGIYILDGTIDNSKIASGYSLASDAQVTNWNAAYTHKSNNGTDHSYINQSVTTSATPQFARVGLGAAAAGQALLHLAINSTGEVPEGMISLVNTGAGEASIRINNGSTGTNSWYAGLNQGDAFKLGYNTSTAGFTDATTKLTVTTAGAVTATSFNSITGLASSAPSNLAATATVGTSTLAARQDHVHKFPTLGDLGYTGATNANYFTYTHPTTEGNKHIPSGGASGNILRWSSAGTATWGADTNTWREIDDTPVDGATTESISSNWAFDHNSGTGNGKHVPAAGSAGQFLAYNGGWATPPNTTYTSADFDHNSLINTHNLSSDLTPAWGNITSKPSFATVATSGSYADLSNKPAANAFTSTEVTNLRAGKLDDGTTPWTNASNLSTGTIASSLLPPLAITSTYVVATEAAQIALVAEEGDVAVRTDLKRSYIHNGGTAGTIADWTELQTPTDSVLSVNGKTGTVSLTYGDVGALASNHDASGVTTTKISNWDAAYTHAGTTHYAEPGIFSGGGTPTLATGVTGAEIRALIGAGTSSTVGTVTSVAMSVPTGLSVSGTPITTSGTLAVSLATGYSIPTTTKQGQWDAAYTNTHASGSDNQTITSGNGMNFTSGSGDVTITLGTPSALSATTTDAVTTSSHTHSIATAAASSLSNSTTNTTGTSTSLARADHTHAISGFALTGHDHDTRYARYVDLTVNTAQTTAAKTTVETVTFEDGVIYNVLFTSGTNVSTPTLNGVNIRLGTTNASTTTLSTGASAVVIPMRYHASTNKLQLFGSHRTSDTVESYTIRWSGASITAGESITQYKIIMMGPDNRFYPITIGNNTTANGKTINSQEFVLKSPILYYSTTATIAENGSTTSTNIYSEVALGTNFRYNQNVQSGWASNEPLYLKGTINASGNFVLAGAGTTGGDYMTQTLPTTEDGFVYILLGFMGTTTTSLRLIHQHPVYEYKDDTLGTIVLSHTHDGTDITSGRLSLDRLPTSATANRFLKVGTANSSPAYATVSSSDVGLGNVENTALSTWAGSSNITTIGTLSSGTVPWARLSNIPSSFTPSSHTHGSITNDGKIGTTANLVVMTGTGGALGAKTAGTTSQYLRGDGSWGVPAGTYTHPSDGGGSIGTALTGANVISQLVVNTAGHVTGTATRALTPANIGAATSGHNHTLDSLSNTTITSNSTGEILKWNGTAWINNTLAEAGIQPAGSYLTGNQTITLSGDVSGSGTTSITVTVADDSHNHVISNVDGLQAALDGKQATGSYLTTATTFGGDVTGTYGAMVVGDDSHNHTAAYITDFDTKVANNTAVAANTAKVSNATHTGEVTGSTSLTIASNVVDADNLKVTGVGTTTQYLRSDGDGTFTWATPPGTYSHPTHTAATNGLYKVTVDASGHVSATTAVVKADITALGIPASNTNTTYTAGTGLALSGTSFSLDFSDLTAMTADISGSTEFILQNGTTESRKAASEIKLSNFNNDSGWTSYAEPGIFSGGGTPSLADGVTGAKIRTLIGAGTSSTTGTVTSVAMTVPTGLSISGSPITSSGTLAVSFASGYSIPTATKQGQWDSAYSHSTSTHAPSNAQANQTVTAGNGMNFSATSGNVTITMGKPSTLTASTSDAVTTSSHTHAITATDAGAASTIVKTGSDGSVTANNTFKFGAAASMVYNNTSKTIDFVFA